MKSENFAAIRDSRAKPSLRMAVALDSAGRSRMKRRLFTLIASMLSVLVLARNAVAQAPMPESSTRSLDVKTVIHRMIARNPELGSYRARVHVHLHMLNFPWLSPNLDGTTYFKRPDNYEVVFDRVPPYAKGFSRFFDDIGDPAAWVKVQNITLQGVKNVDGHRYVVLYMTKKGYSDILASTIAYIDPKTYELLRMDWHYRSGGWITMTQTYKNEGSYSLIAAQHLVIDIPHIHAIGDSNYHTYETNVAVSASVFKKP